jgi:aspartate/tyrosine/aromatic aminotransferase
VFPCDVNFLQSDQKVNLGIGAYRDENGKPWVLGCVKEVTFLINDALHAPFLKGYCSGEFLIQAEKRITDDLVIPDSG